MSELGGVTRSVAIRTPDPANDLGEIQGTTEILIPSTNVRVAGPVLQMLERHTFTTRTPPEGFMARMHNPADGFDPFRMAIDGRDTYIFWIGNPSQLPGRIGSQMARHWKNSLGATFVVQPNSDSYGIIHHHSVVKNSWAPDRKEGERTLNKGLGGIMAHVQATAEHGDLEAVLSDLGYHSIDQIESPEERAAVILMGAAAKVAGKAEAMTTKWRFIDEGLRLMHAPRLTGLGGMKATVLHKPITREDESAKRMALRMMAAVSKVIGMYIAGGDENTSTGPWTDIFAEVAPMAMAGAPTYSDKKLKGQIPNNYTADGVYAAMEVLLDEWIGSKQAPVLYQGLGGVGPRVLQRSVRDNRNIVAVTEVDLDKILQARNYLKEKGYGEVVYVLDQALIQSLPPKEANAIRQRAKEEGVYLAQGLPEVLDVVSRQGHPNIALISPNAIPHQISMDLLANANRWGLRGEAGGANNMLDRDENGSYETIALEAVDVGFLSGNDSSKNRMGATMVLQTALGIEEDLERKHSRDGAWPRMNGPASLMKPTVDGMLDVIKQRAREEIQQGHKKSIPPQIYSDRFAQGEHNKLIEQGMAKGGLYPEDKTKKGRPRGETDLSIYLEGNGWSHDTTGGVSAQYPKGMGGSGDGTKGSLGGTGRRRGLIEGNVAIKETPRLALGSLNSLRGQKKHATISRGPSIRTPMARFARNAGVFRAARFMVR